MERRVVSLWLPSFATDRLIRRRDAPRPGWRSEPASAEGPPLATVTAAQEGRLEKLAEGLAIETETRAWMQQIGDRDHGAPQPSSTCLAARASRIEEPQRTVGGRRFRQPPTG